MTNSIKIFPSINLSCQVKVFAFQSLYWYHTTYSGLCVSWFLIIHPCKFQPDARLLKFENGRFRWSCRRISAANLLNKPINRFSLQHLAFYSFTDGHLFGNSRSRRKTWLYSYSDGGPKLKIDIMFGFGTDASGTTHNRTTKTKLFLIDH